MSKPVSTAQFLSAALRQIANAHEHAHDAGDEFSAQSKHEQAEAAWQISDLLLQIQAKLQKLIEEA